MGHQVEVPFMVDAMDAWGYDRVVCACSDGLVRVFELDVDHDKVQLGTPTVVSLAGEKVYASSILMLQPLGLLLCLCNSTKEVRVLDLYANEERTKIDLAGSKCLSIHPNYACTQIKRNADPLLVVLVTRSKLVIVCWDETGHVATPTTVLPMTDKVRALAWAGSRLCIGTREQYSLVHWKTGRVSPITSVQGSRPMAFALQSPKEGIQELVLMIDDAAFCYDFEGQKLHRKPMEWRSRPNTLVYEHPMLFAIQPDQIHIRNLITNTESNVIYMKGIKGLVLLPNFASRVARLIAFSASEIRYYQGLRLEDQIEALLKKDLFKDAEVLCDAMLTNDMYTKLQHYQLSRRIGILHGYSLFNVKRYIESIQRLQGQCPARQILNMYSYLVPSSIAWGDHPRSVRDLEQSDATDAAAALIPYLYYARSRIRDRRVIALERKRIGQEKTIRRLVSQQHASSHEMQFERFQDIVLDSKRDASSEQVEELQVLIDMTILRCSLQVDGDLVLPFVQTENACEPKATEALLVSYGRFEELIAYYKSIAHHQRALYLLEKHGNGADSSHPLFGHEHTVAYLRDLCFDAQYTDLVLEYATWVLIAHPVKGLSIFTDPSFLKDTSGNSMNPILILRHVQEYLPIDLAIQFLEDVVYIGQSKLHDMHNKLAQLYKDYCLELPDGQERDIVQKSLVRFLYTSTFYDAAYLLPLFPSKDLVEPRAILLGRMEQYRQGIELILNGTHDPAVALEYCNQFWDGTVQMQDIYLCLLRVYFKSKYIDAAYHALEVMPDTISPSSVLSIIPDAIPLQNMVPYLTRITSCHMERSKHVNIARHLRRAEHLKVHAKYLAHSQAFTIVTEDTHCDKCNEPLGIGTSFVVRFPNGIVTDYKCLQNKNECPVTRKRFAKRSS